MILWGCVQYRWYIIPHTQKTFCWRSCKMILFLVVFYIWCSLWSYGPTHNQHGLKVTCSKAMYNFRKPWIHQEAGICSFLQATQTSSLKVVEIWSYFFFQFLVSRWQAFLMASVSDVFSGVLALSRKDGC